MTRHQPFTAIAFGLILLIALALVFAGGQEKAQLPSASQAIETVPLLAETQVAKAAQMRSGLQVGETIASFEVDDVTGPA